MLKQLLIQFFLSFLMGIIEKWNKYFFFSIIIYAVIISLILLIAVPDVEIEDNFQTIEMFWRVIISALGFYAGNIMYELILED